MPAALAAQSPRHWAPGKSHGRPPLSQGWAFAKPPLTQGGSAGRLPAALHVLWGQVLKIWVGGGLGFWGQLGKRPGKSWASEEADRVGEATLDASAGEEPWAEGLQAGRAGSRSTVAASAGQRGSAAAAASPPTCPVPALAAPSWGPLQQNRLPRPCPERAGTQGALCQVGPGRGSRPMGLSH